MLAVVVQQVIFQQVLELPEHLILVAAVAVVPVEVHLEVLEQQVVRVSS